MGLNFDNVFPTRSSFVIFVCYIVLFVAQGLLVTASQDKYNEYGYNIVTVVLVTEICKLLMSIGLFLKDNSVEALKDNVVNERKVMLLYFIPSFLYCLYNNLSFTNLSKYDPTTYYLLLQFRVVVTGIIFQVVFNKVLSKPQWFSLVLLTFGCMAKQIHFSDENYNFTGKSTSLNWEINSAFIFVQIFCSCFAGVYNEYILKKKGAQVDIYIQNIFMYLDSIICNVALLALQGELSNAFSTEGLSQILRFKVILVVLNNALIGIVTSFFLKTLNSILKTYASALELILTAILAYLFFNIPIYLNTAIGIVIVLFASYLYSRNPVNNIVKDKRNNVEEHKLLEEV